MTKSSLFDRPNHDERERERHIEFRISSIRIRTETIEIISLRPLGQEPGSGSSDHDPSDNALLKGEEK